MSTTYGDYMRDRTGWFFGLTGVQLTLVVLAGLPVWLAVNASAWRWLVVWLPVWGLVVLLVVVPVRGWSAAQWAGVLVAHAVGGIMGWTRWQSKVVTGEVEDLDEADLPGVLAGIQIHAGPPYGHDLTRRRGDPGPRPENLGGHCSNRAPRDRTGRGRRTRPDGRGAGRAVRSRHPHRARRGDRHPSPNRPRRRSGTGGLGTKAASRRRTAPGATGQRAARSTADASLRA